jgi:hypothetical protein
MQVGDGGHTYTHVNLSELSYIKLQLCYITVFYKKILLLYKVLVKVLGYGGRVTDDTISSSCDESSVS